jgi:hypothetical protein
MNPKYNFSPQIHYTLQINSIYKPIPFILLLWKTHHLECHSIVDFQEVEKVKMGY